MGSREAQSVSAGVPECRGYTLYRPLLLELVRSALPKRLRPAFLAKMGVDPLSLEGTATHVFLPPTRIFWSTLTEVSGEPAIGIKTAMAMDLARLDLMSELLKQSKDLRTFIEWVCRYLPVLFSETHCHFRVCGGIASLSFSCVSNNERQFHDFLLTLAHRMGRVINPDAENLLVTFPRRASSSSEEELYRQVFRCPVSFQDVRASLEFEARLLDIPNQGGGRLELADLSGWVDRERASVPVVLQIEKVYETAVRRGLSTADEVARLSEVPLRRWRQRLAKSATNHREQLSRARRIAACERLRKEAGSLEEISSALGFTHPSAFIRAFSRWTGATPSAYRRMYRQS